MKSTIFLIIFLAFQTALAQNQPITVLSQKWYEKVDRRIIYADDPFSTRGSEIGAGSIKSSASQTVVGVKTDKYFYYEIVLKNESDQNIIGVALNYVFFDREGKVEKARRSFNFFSRRIKRNKTETLIGRTKNPPDLVLDAKDYESETTQTKDVIEIKCVVFEDQTIWKLQGTDEKVCRDLKIKIKNH